MIGGILLLIVLIFIYGIIHEFIIGPLISCFRFVISNLTYHDGYDIFDRIAWKKDKYRDSGIWWYDERLEKMYSFKNKRGNNGQ